MDFDPNIAAGVNVPQPINPLTAIAGIAQTKNAIAQNQLLQNQNALFGQQFGANIAAGKLSQQAAQGAIDPESGEFSTDRYVQNFAKLVTSDPAVGFRAPEILNQLATRELTAIQAHKEQAAVYGQKYDAFSREMGPLLALGPNVTHDDLISASGRLAAAGLDPKNMAAMLAQAPQGGEALAQWVSQVAQRGADANEQYKAHMAQLGNLDLGNRKILTLFTPATGKLSVGGSFATGMTPAEAATPVNYGVEPASIAGADGQSQPNPAAGAPRTFLKGDLAGGNALLGQSAGGGGGNALLAAGGAPAPAPAPVARGGVQGGPSPLQAKLAEGSAANVVDYEKNLNDRLLSGQTLQQSIGESRQALEHFQAGGLASARLELAKVAQGLGMSQEIIDKIGDKSLTDATEFNKLAVTVSTQLLKQALTGVGGSRINQMEWSAFQNSNPNLDTDPKAIAKIYDFWSKVRQTDLAEQQALNSYKTSGKDLTTFPAAWQQEFESKHLAGFQSKPEGNAPKVDVHYDFKNGKLVPR